MSDNRDPMKIRTGASIVIVKKSGPKKIDSKSGSSLTCKTVSHQKTAYPAKIPPTVFALV